VFDFQLFMEGTGFLIFAEARLIELGHAASGVECTVRSQVTKGTTDFFQSQFDPPSAFSGQNTYL
jgi:hypothetical protein